MGKVVTKITSDRVSSSGLKPTRSGERFGGTRRGRHRLVSLLGQLAPGLAVARTQKAPQSCRRGPRLEVSEQMPRGATGRMQGLPRERKRPQQN